MATERQKKVASLIVENLKLEEPLNAGQIVEKSRYSQSMVIKPGVVINSEGVQEELKILGFDEHSAKKVVAEIMLDSTVKPEARLKATDQVFKLKGSYAPEKQKVEIVEDLEEDEEEAKLYAEFKIKRLLNSKEEGQSVSPKEVSDNLG